MTTTVESGFQPRLPQNDSMLATGSPPEQAIAPASAESADIDGEWQRREADQPTQLSERDDGAVR